MTGETFRRSLMPPASTGEALIKPWGLPLPFGLLASIYRGA